MPPASGVAGVGWKHIPLWDFVPHPCILTAAAPLPQPGWSPSAQQPRNVVRSGIGVVCAQRLGSFREWALHAHDRPALLPRTRLTAGCKGWGAPWRRRSRGCTAGRNTAPGPQLPASLAGTAPLLQRPPGGVVRGTERRGREDEAPPPQSLWGEGAPPAPRCEQQARGGGATGPRRASRSPPRPAGRCLPSRGSGEGTGDGGRAAARASERASGLDRGPRPRRRCRCPVRRGVWAGPCPEPEAEGRRHPPTPRVRSSKEAAPGQPPSLPPTLGRGRRRRAGGPQPPPPPEEKEAPPRPAPPAMEPPGQVKDRILQNLSLAVKKVRPPPLTPSPPAGGGGSGASGALRRTRATGAPPGPEPAAGASERPRSVACRAGAQ